MPRRTKARHEGRATVPFSLLFFALASVCFDSPAVASNPPTPRGFEGCFATQGSAVLLETSADRLFTPASVTKVVMTAAALHYLGPEYRVTTRISTTGGLAANVLKGNLLIHAAGDPTWSQRFQAKGHRPPAEIMAEALRRRGIGRIEGDLVIDTSALSGRAFPTSRAYSEIAFPYGAPTSALAVDENTIGIVIAPGAKPGDAVRFEAPEGGYELVSLAKTVGSERKGKGTVDFQPSWDGEKLIIRGEYPISEGPYRISVAVGDGDLHAGRTLARQLLELGIAIRGKVRISHRAVTGRALVEIHSAPLADWLPPILRRSHNWLTEMLLRQLALGAGGQGRDELGLELVSRLLEDEVGLPSEAFFFEDGSGLSPYNLLTPRATVDLLRWIWRQPWRDLYLDALSAPRRGTLSSWPPMPAATRGKTGTLQSSAALAGFLLPPTRSEGSFGNAEPTVFACYVLHRPEGRADSRRYIASQIRALAR